MMFVAVPGTDPYQAMPRHEVMEKLAAGSLSEEQLIWSEKRNEWTPANKISSLIQIEPPRAPVATPVKPLAAKPRAMAGAAPATDDKSARPALIAGGASTMKVAQPAAAQAKPAAAKAKAKAAAPVAKKMSPQPVQTSAPAGSLVIKEEGSSAGFWLKTVCVLLIVVIIGLLGFNWYAVDRPYKGLLAAQAPEIAKDTTTYAHLGGFFQAGTLVIHLPSTPGVTQDNFIDFLVALSKSTPRSPTGKRYEIVTFGPGWYRAPYYIAGVDWEHIGDGTMNNDDIRSYLLDTMRVGGTGSLRASQNLVYEKRMEIEDANWKAFVNRFVQE